MSSRPPDAAFRLMLARLLWGWEPHPTQRTWLFCEAKIKVAACGRRWGKTEAAAVDASSMALACPGCAQMIVSPTYDQSRLIFDTVERMMLGAPATRPLARVVRTPYPRLSILGSTITARTADEDGRNLRGHAADRVIVDEAAYVRDSVIHEVISPMLADRNGRLVMISTPFGKNHFYRAFLQGAESSQSRYASFTFPSWANPHISREYIEEQRRTLSPRQFAVEYEAQFLDDQSSVFRWDEIEAAAERGAGHLLPGSAAQPGDFECVVAGIDWARYSDYTALVAVGVGASGCAVVGLDRFSGMPWSRQIERAADFLATHRACSVLTDQSSVGDPLLEQLRTKLWDAGIQIAVDGFIFTNQSKRDLVEHLALIFAHGAIAIPRDEHLMRELQFFEYEITQSGAIRLNARGGYHDDLVIALALACRQARGVSVGGAVVGGSGRLATEGW